MSILDEVEDRWTPEPNTGCYLWHGRTNGRGYARKTINKKAEVVSRLVCEEVNGPPPTSEHRALHDTPNGCVGPACVNGDHLRWGTQYDNAYDIPADRRSEKMRRVRTFLSPEQRIEFARKAAAIRWEMWRNRK